MNSSLSANTMPVLPVRLKGEIDLRSAKSLLGMPVIMNGKVIGKVAYVLPDAQLRTLSGLYLYCGVTGSRFIDSSHLDMIGDIAVLSHSAGQRKQLLIPPLFRRAFSLDGRRIGAITDTVIGEDTLRVEALELTRGYLDDLTGGRTRIRQFSVQKNGDVIVEPPEGGNLT